jgi:hypothetical protein
MGELPVEAGQPPRGSRLMAFASQYGFELPLILGIAGALAYDRSALCREYLFRYLDEDQACMWYAAHDLLHGRIAEPAFYGQDYNSCLEGFLAAPLVALHVPYNIACPLVTVLLGLLPFGLLALIACRRRNFLAAAGALLIPLLMSNRYGMICGIPRGFINGIAVSAIPMILLLPRPKRAVLVGTSADASLAPGKETRRTRIFLSGLRYFFAGALAVVALQVNPNCVILLGPVAVYAMLSRFFDWKMWVFTPLGIAAAMPYPWYVHQFYHVYHPDYVLYLRDYHFGHGHSYFTSFLNFAAPTSGPSPVFADLVPMFVTGVQAPRFLILAFSVVAGCLLIRLRIAAVCAMLAGAAIMFASFAFERVSIGEPSNTASYPYSRMWLALPVLFAWLLFLVNYRPWALFAGMKWTKWLMRGTLAMLLCAALYFLRVKERQLPEAIDAELDTPGFVICPAVPVANLYAMAREIKKVADAQHADLLIVGGGDPQKHIAYAIPALLGIETIFPDFERRTFRMIEESKAKHDKILLIFDPYRGTPVGGGRLVELSADGTEVSASDPPDPSGKSQTHPFILPVITMIDADGRNAYEIPELVYMMPQLTVPEATPGNPKPEPQVYRPPWQFP